MSKHLKVLEDAGLIRRDVRGREHHISLAADLVREVADFTEHFRQFWEERLDALDIYLHRRRLRRGHTDSHDREEDDDAD